MSEQQKNYAPPAGAFGCVTGKTGQMGSGTYEKPGHTIQRIDEVRYNPGRKNKPAVIIEKTILHVISCPAKWSNGKPGAVIEMKPMFVGEKVVDFVSLQQDYAGDALAAFLQTCFPSVAPGAVTPEHVASACGEEQPCRGFILEVHSEERPNREDTVVYVRTVYDRLVPAKELEEVLTDAGVRVLGGTDVLVAMIQREAAAV